LDKLPFLQQEALIGQVCMTIEEALREACAAEREKEGIREPASEGEFRRWAASADFFQAASQARDQLVATLSSTPVPGLFDAQGAPGAVAELLEQIRRCEQLGMNRYDLNKFIEVWAQPSRARGPSRNQ
jgi:hypothetical protein